MNYCTSGKHAEVVHGTRLTNHVSGVMVSVLTSSAVVHGTRLTNHVSGVMVSVLTSSAVVHGTVSTLTITPLTWFVSLVP
jgi:hypothetical protein